MHPQVEFRRRLNLRKLIEQPGHRAEFIHAQSARSALGQVLLHLQPLAFFQPPIHVSEDAAFHSFTTHDYPPSLPLLPCSLRNERG